MVRRGQRNRIRWEDIKSPCVKICTLENGVCIGCGRTQDEIREWVIMTDNQREKINLNKNKEEILNKKKRK